MRQDVISAYTAYAYCNKFICFKMFSCVTSLFHINRSLLNACREDVMILHICDNFILSPWRWCELNVHLQGVSGKMAVFTHRWLFIFFCFTPQLISFSPPPFLSFSLLLPIRMPMGIGSELFVSRWENWKRNSVVFHLPSRTVC